MGKKVSPISFRNGIVGGWNQFVSWFDSKNDLPVYLHEDYLIRKFFRDNCNVFFINTKIERIRKKINITLFFQRGCAFIIRNKKKIMIKQIQEVNKDEEGTITDVPVNEESKNKKIKEQKIMLIKENLPFFQNELKKYLAKNTIYNRNGNRFDLISVPEFNIALSPSVEMSAQVICNTIADNMINRIDYKKYIRSVIKYATRNGAAGILIKVKGRLKGSAYANKETFKVGKMSLQTLDVNVQYCTAIAKTKYGICGVKVYLCLQDSNYGGI